MNFIYISHHFTAREDMNSTNWPRSQCVANHSSVGRASHRYHGGDRFESHWSPDVFRLLYTSNCLNWNIYCDDHSSLSSTTTAQYEFHIYFTMPDVLLSFSTYWNSISIAASRDWIGRGHLFKNEKKGFCWLWHQTSTGVRKKCCKSIHPNPSHSSLISFCLCWWLWRGRRSFWYMTSEDTHNKTGFFLSSMYFDFFLVACEREQ